MGQSIDRQNGPAIPKKRKGYSFGALILIKIMKVKKLKNLPEIFYYYKDFDISAENQDFDKLMQFLNLCHVGNKNINKYDKNRKLVPLYTPEQEKPLGELHWRARTICLARMKIGVDKNMNIVSIERA